MHALDGITKRFEYSGGGKELLLIALKTGFLTLITLGIYRFWAKTKFATLFGPQPRLMAMRLNIMEQD